MSDPKAPPNLNASPLEVVLYLCDKARPEPWYPATFSRDTGIPRDVLDPHLDRLRLAGLIRLTDWVAGSGQGYTLTPAGEQTLANPRALAALRQGKMPPAGDPAPAAAGNEGTTSWERGEQVRDAALLHPGRGVVTRALIFLNVAVFLIGLLVAGQFNAGEKYFWGGDSRVFARIGGLTGQDLLRGRWWELLTCCFVHAGLFHIGFNMYALSALGPRAEQLWGRGRFLTLYLIAGLVGSCAAMISYPVGCVGASGAVYGLLGAEVIFLLLNRHHLPSRYVAAWGKNLAINGALMLMVNTLPGISGAAHWGGAVGGAVCAGLLTYQRFGTPAQRRLALIGLALTPVVAVSLLIHAMGTQANWLKYTQRAEANTCKDEVSPIAVAINEFWKAFTDNDHDDGVATLLTMRRTEWRAEDVARAVGRLRRHREELDRVAERIAALGPFRTPIPMKFLAASRNLLQEEAKLAELAESVLQTDQGWREKEKALTAQLTQVTEARNEWDDVRDRVEQIANEP